MEHTARCGTDFGIGVLSLHESGIRVVLSTGFMWNIPQDVVQNLVLEFCRSVVE